MEFAGLSAQIQLQLRNLELAAHDTSIDINDDDMTHNPRGLVVISSLRESLATIAQYKDKNSFSELTARYEGSTVPMPSDDVLSSKCAHIYSTRILSGIGLTIDLAEEIIGELAKFSCMQYITRYQQALLRAIILLLVDI